jgi:hypothetical protein
VSAFFVIGWNVVWTSLIMLFIKYVCRIPLRMTDAACKIGDYAVHQEESYTFAYFNRSLIPRRGAGGEDELETGLHGIIMGRAMPEEAHHTGRPSGDIGPNDDSPSASAREKVETKKEA